MTESSGRLDPLQSYPAITIPSFLWGNTEGRERKLDQIFTEERAGVAGERDETPFSISAKASFSMPWSKSQMQVQLLVLNMLNT